MSTPIRIVVGPRLAAVALAVGIWGLSGGSARAQGLAAPPGTYSGLPGYASSLPAVYGLDNGRFGPGYPGYGLEYGRGNGHFIIHRYGFEKNPSGGNWVGYVLGRECLYPYVADPYSDPRAALGFWPPYSAPAGW